MASTAAAASSSVANRGPALRRRPVPAPWPVREACRRARPGPSPGPGPGPRRPRSAACRAATEGCPCAASLSSARSRSSAARGLPGPLPGRRCRRRGVAQVLPPAPLLGPRVREFGPSRAASSAGRLRLGGLAGQGAASAARLPRRTRPPAPAHQAAPSRPVSACSLGPRARPPPPRARSPASAPSRRRRPRLAGRAGAGCAAEPQTGHGPPSVSLAASSAAIPFSRASISRCGRPPDLVGLDGGQRRRVHAATCGASSAAGRRHRAAPCLRLQPLPGRVQPGRGGGLAEPVSSLVIRPGSSCLARSRAATRLGPAAASCSSPASSASLGGQALLRVPARCCSPAASASAASARLAAPAPPRPASASSSGSGDQVGSSPRAARPRPRRLGRARQQRPDRLGPPGGGQPTARRSCSGRVRLVRAQIRQRLGQPGHQRRLLPRLLVLGRRPRGRQPGDGQPPAPRR